IAAGPDSFRLTNNQLVGIHIGLLAVPCLCVAKIIAEPAQGKSRALRDAHHMPFSWNRMAERVDAPAWIEFGRVRISKDDARSTQRGRGKTWQNDTVADGAGRLIARPSHHWGSGAEAGEHSHFLGDFSRDLRRFEGLGQDLRVDSERAKHLRRPAAVRDIKKQSPGGVRNVSGKLAGQTVTDKILGEQEMSDALVHLGLVIANPENF